MPYEIFATAYDQWGIEYTCEVPDERNIFKNFTSAKKELISRLKNIRDAYREAVRSASELKVSEIEE